MRKLKIVQISFAMILLLASNGFGGSGSGEFSLGYISLDHDGSQAVYHPSFNVYDGVGISLDNFRYRFDNGMTVRSSLRNISLDNRNINFDLRKSGLFGLDFSTNQNRRVYGSEDDINIKRNTTGFGGYVYPRKQVKLYFKGLLTSHTGDRLNQFELLNNPDPSDVDYKQQKFTYGINVNNTGRMFRAEYSSIKYSDDINPERDQTRGIIKLNTLLSIPEYDWFNLTGDFTHFTSKYDETDLEIKSTAFRGGAVAKLTQEMKFNYILFFNRSVSDSDFVDTDNLAHAFYLSYDKFKTGGITAGYQYDINDAYEEAVTANSYFFSGWYLPKPNLEIKSQYGFRKETLDEGTRLLGDEDRNRFKASIKYSMTDRCSHKLKYEMKHRENSLLDRKTDFSRITYETARRFDFARFSGGIAYSVGEFENTETMFEFTDTQVFGDLELKEIKKLTLGAGVIYYRSLRDLDLESTNLNFRGTYKFGNGFKFKAVYRIFNFDDLNTVIDQYYTDNIVELGIIKSFSF